MHLPADLLLASRYLRPKRTFISVITLLSILGPILGVALLVIVTSVMSGFDRDIRTRILDMQAHIEIQPSFELATGRPGIFEDPAPLLETIHKAGAKASPLISGPVLIQIREQVDTKFVKGIVPDTERQVTGLARSLKKGRFEVGEGEAIIGQEMALQLNLRLGDQFLIHSPRRLTESISWGQDGQLQVRENSSVYLPEEVTVIGISDMGVYEYDSSMIFIHLDQAADLFGLEWGSATSVHAAVPDPFDMSEIADEVRAKLSHCRVVTWQQANRKLFEALRVEKNLMFFLLTFIVIVAAFGISGTLITVVVQKTREIGILKAVGMPSLVVARIFVLQGTVIGVLGTTLGTGLGLLIVHCRNQVAALLARIMNVEIFPKELYHLSQIPAQVTPSDVTTIAVLALLICIAASLVPALYASCLSPAAALQEEN
ncbi:MAG: ABC transporter permease [Lentisphaerae bacterium]|jgi:lipoprotein-releasing system permease protein|nr:ABC transporter permease [Lentisphaerota bacterium]MBT5607427.1 ABC transporter permease [Lentisphaerota bacterium]MBT7056135.1 ABC transporter permease [Lentisphaerota bacterium]MBT7841373.1 ABC transporter permease [Lentisphaerota bacterium]